MDAERRLPFRLEAEDGPARAGTLTIRGREVATPAFMPVGTQATVRGQTRETLWESGSRILLANTYHLMQKPGAETLRKLGGIHRFMKWGGAVLTDSGGYQVFSLGDRARVDEDGVTFRPHPDAAPLRMTPEISIATQASIGSDIAMAFDQCIPSTAGRELAEAALERTHRWAERSLRARGADSPQSLFGIVQGACFADLRKKSAGAITSLPFDGFAIGGLAVGETRAEREEFTALTAELLPRNRPRYLMGVGTPIDLLEAVARGVDLFDCILPTAFAQQGLAFTSQGKVQLRRTVYRLSEAPLDPQCVCPTCQTHSRAYLHHLIAASEVLGWSLIGQHNLHFYHSLTRRMRESILKGEFGAFYRLQRETLVQDDPENPPRPVLAARRKGPARVLGGFELVEAEPGVRATASIRCRESGEVMHSVLDPVEEAHRLYVEQSRLRERLSQSGAGEGAPLLVWDVGMGMAANAMAAIREAEALESEGMLARPLQVISFERDLDALRLALKHAPHFPHLHHPAPSSLIKEKEWRSPSDGIRWVLLEGDFLVRLDDAPAADLIFHDPFSPKVDSPLWTESCFRRMRVALRGNPASLYTYSNSTAVRTSLLLAEFWVAQGVSTGPKPDTTIAFSGEPNEASEKCRLLGPEWLARWRRSGARVPPGSSAGSSAGASDSDAVRIEEALRSHPQFRT